MADQVSALAEIFIRYSRVIIVIDLALNYVVNLVKSYDKKIQFCVLFQIQYHLRYQREGSLICAAPRETKCSYWHNLEGQN